MTKLQLNKADQSNLTSISENAATKPDWLRVKAPQFERIGNTANLLSDLKLNYYDSWCHIFLKEVPDPERFGVPVFQGMDRHLIKVEEKPEKPMSDYAVTGLYMFNDEVWSVIDTLKPSERGELEVVDLINWYIDRGKTTHSELKGFWSDAGTPDSLVQANKLVSERSKDA